jgi:hypothetical protein
MEVKDTPTRKDRRGLQLERLDLELTSGRNSQMAKDAIRRV